MSLVKLKYEYIGNDASTERDFKINLVESGVATTLEFDFRFEKYKRMRVFNMDMVVLDSRYEIDDNGDLNIIVMLDTERGVRGRGLKTFGCYGTSSII